MECSLNVHISKNEPKKVFKTGCFEDSENIQKLNVNFIKTFFEPISVSWDGVSI